MNIFTKKWWIAAGVRAVKTFAEGALAVLGTEAAFIHEVNWLAVLSTAGLAGILSLLMSLAGLPEAEDN